MIGRSDRIRTYDPCVPNAVLYQTEPHSDDFFKRLNLYRLMAVLASNSYGFKDKSLSYQHIHTQSGQAHLHPFSMPFATHTAQHTKPAHEHHRNSKTTHRGDSHR